MSTIIYPSPIFGPVHSRRLGISLGINLMPADGKVCTFDCIYCECGLNADHRPTLPRPTREEVARALEATLRQMAADGQHPDVLTFAGNGEPTAHPEFAGIIDDTIRLRDALCPLAKVSVLSNATQLHRKDVFDALLMTATCKLGAEEFVKTLTAHFFADESAWEDNDVGIVVFADEMCNLRSPDKTGADALVLVEGHGDAFARTAHGNAAFHFTSFDAFSQLVTIGGIVATVFGVSAVVLIFNALLLQVALDELLERKSCMIRCYTNGNH